MSREKFDEYQKKFPNLFKEYPRCGFYLCEGWTSILDALCPILESHIKELPNPEDFYCVQVKEKFGGLRFYMNRETPFISGAIAAAEQMSFYECDVCGSPAKPRTGGWVRTLCDLHHEENQKRREEERKKWQEEHPEDDDDLDY